jgi:outer membrane protein TolC
VIILLCGLALAMTPDEAVRSAMKNNPVLAAAEAEFLSAEGAWRSASGLRYNPQIDIAGDIGGRRLEASITQDIPVSGAGVADARSGRHAVDAARARRSRARVETAAEARLAWARLAAADGVLRAAEGERASAAGIRNAAEKRRDVGEASDLEVELARLEEARAVAGWLAALDERAEVQAALAALTGQPEASAEGDPLEAVPARGTGGARSDVAAASARVEAARAAVTRERAEGLPPLGLGAFLEVEGDRVLGGPSVRIELPFWQQNAAGRGEAKGNLLVAEAEASATRARAEAEQRLASQRLDLLGAVGAALAPGVDRSAEVALRALDAGVARGEIDPVQAALLRARVFEGQRAWYTARLAEAEGRIDAALAIEDAGLLAP